MCDRQREREVWGSGEEVAGEGGEYGGRNMDWLCVARVAPNQRQTH